MKQISYPLIAPLVFKKKIEPLPQAPQGQHLLKTLKAAVCASDLHYYLGHKAKEKLKLRLPVVLLHEGVCFDTVDECRVVPVAGDLTKTPVEYQGIENIFPGLPYMGSTADGLACNYLNYPRELLLPVPEEVSDDLACLTEPLSIVFHSLHTLHPQFFHQVAIVGDGTMAYLLALILHLYYGISPQNLTVYGIHDAKLALFSEFAQTTNIDDQDVLGKADVVFEAVGGPEMQRTLDLCLKLSVPGAQIGIIGVSDDRPSLGISKLVNWGISMIGLTRSVYSDYEHSLLFMTDSKNQKYLQKFIYPQQFTIRTSEDLKAAFDCAAATPLPGRVLVSFS